MLVWRLETGETVGLLDILAGSSSLTSTVTSQLKLRLVSIYGLALIAIWLLSPVGGQACLRQMTSSDLSTSENASCTYMSPQGDLSHVQSGASVGSQYAIIDGTFAASMLASPAVKASPIDAFGNVKIPKIEVCEKSSSPDHEGWYDTSIDPPTFSSLVGLPLYWTQAPENADYATIVEAQYLNLDCIVNGPLDTVKPQIEWKGAGSEIGTVEITTERGRISRTNSSALEPFTFSYSDYGRIKSSQCSFTTTYVEAEISCPGNSTCHVSRIRRSPGNATSTAYTTLDNPGSTYYNLPMFFDRFKLLMGGHTAQNGPVQNYIMRPDNPVRSSGPEDEVPSSEIFALRLG